MMCYVMYHISGAGRAPRRIPQEVPSARSWCKELGDVKIMWGDPFSDGLHFAVVIYIVVITHKYLKKRKPE